MQQISDAIRANSQPQKLTKLFALGALSMAMISCSSFKKADSELADNSSSGRAPASLGSSAGGANVPAGPDGHGSRGTLTPRPGGRSGDIDQGFETGCRIRNLETLDMGGSFSAMDILNRIQEQGTFSGYVNGMAPRESPLVGGYKQWVWDQATFVERDADFLRPWLTGSAPGLSEEQVSAIASKSEAYQYAIGFTEGSGPLGIFNDQYDIGHRMAALMAVQFALVSKGDLNCLKYVKEKIAPKILPDAESRKLLNQVRFEEVAGLVKEGRLDDVFIAMHQTRSDLSNQITSVKQELSLQQDANKWELEKIRFDLDGAYQEVSQQIASIPGCGNSADWSSIIYGFGSESSSSSSSVRNIQSEISNCQRRVRDRLIEARRDQLRIQGSIRVYEGRTEMAQERMERAEERGQDTARYEREIARYQAKLEDLRASNEKALEAGKRYEEGLEMIANPDTSSFAAELDRIRELTEDKRRRESDAFFANQRQQLARLNGELNNTSTHYLTTGFAGGFSNSFHDGADIPFDSMRGPATGPEPRVDSNPNYQDLY